MRVGPDREELFERVRDAATAFYAAAAAHTKAVNEFGHMLDHSDGSFALLQTARCERDAIEEYHRALKALADFLNLES